MSMNTASREIWVISVNITLVGKALKTIYPSDLISILTCSGKPSQTRWGLLCTFCVILFLGSYQSLINILSNIFFLLLILVSPLYCKLQKRKESRLGA